MRTLTFEQLRINLTLTFDTLDEPVEVVRRGKVVGYIVSNLQDTVVTGKSGKTEIIPCEPMPEHAKSIMGVSGDTVYEPDPVKLVRVKKESVKKGVVPIVETLLAGVKVSPTVQHHPQCKCGVCKNG